MFPDYFIIIQYFKPLFYQPTGKESLYKICIDLKIEEQGN